MEWDKHGVQPDEDPTQARRLAVPITPQLDQAIQTFKDTYAPRKFSDTAVLKTMIEAGFRVWYSQQQSVQDTQQTSDTQPDG